MKGCISIIAIAVGGFIMFGGPFCVIIGLFIILASLGYIEHGT